jgi:hypothetical protein
MAQYYSHSSLTIATTTSNPEHGLFVPKTSVPWKNLIQLPYRDRNGNYAGNFYVYRRAISLANNFLADVRKCDLLLRGWVTQEWMLSRRFLWYTPSGLFFECHTDLTRTERGETLVVHRTNPEDRSYLLLKSQMRVDNTSIMDLWYYLVTMYSSTNLTEPGKDRILAISGLASEFKVILNSQNRGIPPSYTSGLWLTDIHHGLLWTQKRFHDKYPEACRAPSWSWASFLDEIVWPQRKRSTKPACTVIGLCLNDNGSHSSPEIKTIMNASGLQIAQGAVNTVGNKTLPLFGVENMFTCLHLCGKVQVLHVRGYLTTNELIKQTAKLCGRHKSDAASGVDTWRAVCAPFEPDSIAGWGSFEHLETEQACADAGFALYALHISSTWNNAEMEVLEVVYMNLRNDGRFTRLGVGQIFDARVIKGFERSKSVKLALI